MAPASNEGNDQPSPPLIEKNKRVSPRISIASAVAYVMIDRNKRILGRGVARVLDLSRGGLKLQTREAIQAPFMLLSLMTEEEKAITILGKITHCQEIGRGIFHSGVKFMEDDEKSKRVVIGLVKAHALRKHLLKGG